MSVGRRLIGDTVVFATATIASRGISLLLLPLYTRFLGTAEYGAFDMLMSLNRALFLPASLGMDSGLALAWHDVPPSEQRRLSTSCLVLQAGWLAMLVGVLAWASPLVARVLFGEAGRRLEVMLVLALLVAQVLGNFAAIVAKWKRESWRFFALTVGSAAVAGGGSAIMVAGLGRGAAGAVIGLAGGSLIALPVSFALIRRHFAPAISVKAMRRCLALGLPFAANGAAELLFPLALRLIILGSGGLAAVGVFGSANTICLTVILLAYAFTGAWWPFALSPEGRRIRGEWPRVLRLLALMQIALVAVLAVLAPFLTTSILGGGSYAAAAPLIGPLALAYWTKGVRQETGVGLVADGLSWAYSAFGVLAIALSLALAWILSPHLGLTGAAWGMVAGECCALAGQATFAARRSAAIFEPIPMMAMALAFLAIDLAANTVVMPTAFADAAWRAVLLGGFAAVLVVSRAAPLRDLRHAARLLRDLQLRRPMAPPDPG